MFVMTCDGSDYEKFCKYPTLNKGFLQERDARNFVPPW
ncbi:unnamed protein product [Fusarium venenatum]|uniref:Uncharacterized protein n=1 Tax=Fusarium venenatum TaxID=56646 RepID=A0A2L2T6R6_9HYPO|nr:uncharacterized protein FVRRES_03014 [Fusarium venenatum]CEI66502.1 unnamed protein product [Fusarium venenatum]